MKTYYTFIRSATNWREFSSAEKKPIDTRLSYSEASEKCKEWNADRSDTQIENGTMMEFEEE